MERVAFMVVELFKEIHMVLVKVETCICPYRARARGHFYEILTASSTIDYNGIAALPMATTPEAPIARHRPSC